MVMKRQNPKPAIFEVKTNALCFWTVTGMFEIVSKPKGLHHYPVAACVISCCWKCLSAGKILGRVDHSGVWVASTVHLGCTKVISKMSKIYVDEVYHRRVLIRNGVRHMPQPEKQESSMFNQAAQRPCTICHKTKRECVERMDADRMLTCHVVGCKLHCWSQRMNTK